MSTTIINPNPKDPWDKMAIDQQFRKLDPLVTDRSPATLAYLHELDEHDPTIYRRERQILEDATFDLEDELQGGRYARTLKRILFPELTMAQAMKATLDDPVEELIYALLAEYAPRG